MRHLKMTIAATAFWLLLAAPPARAASAPPALDDNARIELARVDEHVITARELEAFLKIAYLDENLRKQLDALAPLHREQLLAEGRRTALTELIERELILTEGRKVVQDNPNVKEAIDMVVEERLRKILNEKGSHIATHEWLREQGLTMQDWKDLLADLIVMQNYLWENVNSHVRATPAEIRRYYENNKESLRLPRRIAYRLIIVDPAGCQTADEERARAETVLSRVKEGEDFGKLADEFSLDRARTKGGLHQVEAPAAPADWFPPLCGGLQPGQCSGVVKTEAGYCITKLERVEESRTPSFDEVQELIGELLRRKKTDLARRELIDELRRKIHIEVYPEGRKILGDSAQF